MEFSIGLAKLPVFRNGFSKYQGDYTELKDGQRAELLRNDNSRHIINYAAARAVKDSDNRQRAIRRFEKLLKTNKLTKAQINNKGYDRLLKMDGEITVALITKR